jgi:hypothetical protein
VELRPISGKHRGKSWFWRLFPACGANCKTPARKVEKPRAAAGGVQAAWAAIIKP